MDTLSNGGKMLSESNFDSCKLWTNCLDYVALRVNNHSFNTWFKHTRGSQLDDGSLKIIVPNRFVADWLSDRYADLIDEALIEINGTVLPYIFEIKSGNGNGGQTEIEFDSRPAAVRPVAPAVIHPSYALNGKYRFDNFVVGSSNQFAHAAALAVSEAPGKTNYNPLFIYGGTGLGKTHLLEAIGNAVKEKYPGKRIIYASSEKFTSDFINSLSNGTTLKFTSLYRTADLLLIDDTQFFSGKESTQEQFFHTFNDLYHSGRQIVLTSDRHPKDTKGLEERLLSRFASGLVADLQPPDLETRMAILRRRVEQDKASLPEDVLYFIANNVTTNIRELEGCLTRLIAYGSINKAEINLGFAQQVLGKDVFQVKKEITIRQVQKKTAEVFNIEPDAMTAKKKTAPIALARQVAMYLTRKHTSLSLKAIGEGFGGRDHSTVIHACELVARKIEEDSNFRRKVADLTHSLLA